jgi:pyruvate dehydrogenase E1 component
MAGFDLLPDPDPSLTAEWHFSSDELLRHLPAEHAAFVMASAAAYAKEQIASILDAPLNDVPLTRQGTHPGDLELEQRLEEAVRWNAMALVQRANHKEPGIGGHLSTFASSATIVETLRNHFVRGHDHELGSDRVFFQGHSSPGMYARAFVEGRFTTDQLDLFRREVAGAPGLSSYPHPRLMPEFWEQPTVSMGLGPLTAIHAALMDRYLLSQGLITSLPRTFAIIGDGETDEPETLGALTVASRENLSNLVFIVVCNLQRLDGPVRGYSSIVAELTKLFRGASWRVIRALWGSSWDPFFAHPTSHVLAQRLANLSDGDLQRLSTLAPSDVLRAELTQSDPRLEELFRATSNEDLARMLTDRAGHDPKKVYAALHEAVDNPTDSPTVLLVLAEKGHLLPGVESRNAAHQVKGLSKAQLHELASRLRLTDRVSSDALDEEFPPYVELDDVTKSYLADRLSTLGGPVPRRLAPTALPHLSDPTIFDEFDAGSPKEVSTTVAHTRLLRLLCRDKGVGPRVVPIVADEGRTFGFEPLYAEFGVHAPGTYKGVDAHLPLAYKENTTGKFIQAGISEAGALASFTSAGLWAYNELALLPVYEFYSMFGFQRVADLIWAAADAGASGVLAGATAGRTTLNGEGLQHADGHSMVWAQSVPDLWAYDPAFAFETADVYKSLLKKLNAGSPQLVYLTMYNENFTQPARPSHVTTSDVMSGGYVFKEANERLGTHVALCFSGSSYLAARDAQGLLLEYGVSSDLVALPGVKALVEDARSSDRARRLGLDAPIPHFTTLLEGRGPAVFVSDWTQSLVAPLVPHAPHGISVLGTDGFGRSSSRAELRTFFETSAAHVALAALTMVADRPVREAAERWGVDTAVAPAWER